MQIAFPQCISCSWEYTKSTRPYQAFETLAHKVMDFVYPENELTKRRSFKFIPNFVVNALGYMTYASACPSYKTLKPIESDADLKALVNDVNEVFNDLVRVVKEKCPSTKNMSWEIRVKKDNTVNAFCCPGGKVAITTGMLEMMKGRAIGNITRKDLIAAVLGHEIVHAVAEHSAKRMQISIFSSLVIKCAAYGLSVLFVRKPNVDETLKGDEKKKAEEKLVKNREDLCKTIESICSIPAFFLQTGHSQFHEFEADELGITIAHKAIYNIDASVSLQQMFLAMKGQSKDQQKGLLQKAGDAISSHPPSNERLQKNQETINRLRGLA
ncbi:M48 family metalloprotease [Candidatus Rhabdochlamydia sp. T3358]|uniref:M48 family metalloprotease n=1 Tax=Candidatus Rhabdochlamydia sp. T3358 TaxID=2099795 RepID=UPI0010BC4064|nr:M48 family metalloprotease [Candidatus Rhabdochlamydia sp. T3358]VHO02838.1 Protease HtpX [Candidatus Rhabdochlamydia sp. T3358]